MEEQGFVRSGDVSLRLFVRASTPVCAQVKAASSLLSLAPLRHSRVPRFPDEECLEHQGAQVEIVERSYNRSTWGRRWLVRLLMWFGLVTTVTAAAMIVTGRKLHSRCATILSDRDLDCVRIMQD